MLFFRSVALVGCAAHVFSKPLNAPVVRPRQDGGPLSAEQTVCGDLIVAARNNYTLFFASDVYECLQRVPFNDAVATRFIDYYNTTLQFQSTLAFLKDPPLGYQQPSVDVQQVLSQIQSNITAGNYKNQYSFEVDVQRLVHRMHDSHVTLGAGILDAFTFISPYSVVSVSEDGKKVPEIYLSDDLLDSQLQGWTASPVATINGQDVIEYLTQFAELNSNGYLESNADWNALMDNPALYISGQLSVIQSVKYYPGNELNCTFKNDTSASTYWLAIYNELYDTGPLTTAGDFYNYFVLGLLPASYDPEQQWWPNLGDNSTSDNSTLDDPYQAICSRGNPAEENWCVESYGAYPNNPDVYQPGLSVIKGGVVTGYFYEDISTGILSIPSFYSYNDNIDTFGVAVASFIGNATEKNISRVVIDLQTNTGGNVYLAYNVFKNFFYAMDPYAASRIRSHELADVLGNTYSTWWKELEGDLDGNEGANGVNYNYSAADEWVINNRINAATGQKFSSWSDYSGKVSERGDSFSAAQRYNLSDEVFDSAAFGGWVPYGYGIAIDDNPDPAPWAPEDIVILTDGACSSSCALFVELMSHQAGVRTMVVGGRPNTGPMQAVSGSRGAREYDASQLDADFEFVSETIENTTAAALLPNRTDHGMWINTAGINIRDQVRASDNTPLQFKYEAADCRIYYTKANVFNMSRLWRDAAAAAFDDPSLCVAGSTGFPSARNTSSTVPPPARPAQSLDTDLDLAQSISLAGNDTLGYAHDLQAGPVRKTGEIKACGPSNQCDIGQCSITSLRCAGRDTPVRACLPSCSSNNPSCPAGADCDLDYRAPSKSNEVSNKIRSARLSQPLYFGLCRPTNPSPRLGCPK